MASQLSHMLAGTEALKRALPENQAAILADHGAWFRLGCQGPDIFYHNQRTRPLSIYYGSLLHKHSFGLFIAALAKNLSREPINPESAAFLLGFATHAALDRKTHPYIVYRSGWFDPAKPETKIYRGSHIFLERILDILAWEKESAATIADFRQTELLVPKGETPPVLEQALASALAETYPRRAGADGHVLQRIKNGFLDTTHIFALTDPSRPMRMSSRHFSYYEHDPHSIAMLYPASVPPEIDWANSHHEPWRFPCEPVRPSTSSYFDLVDDSIAETVPILALLGRMLFGPSDSEAVTAENLGALSRLIGQASLNLSDGEGIQKAPVWSQPLPTFPLMRRIHEKLLADTRLQDF